MGEKKSEQNCGYLKAKNMRQLRCQFFFAYK